MRMVRHPGPPESQRWLLAPVSQRSVAFLRIASNDDLLTAIKRHVIQCRGSGAWFRLLSGEIASLEFMTGKPGDTPIVAQFSGPHWIACPATVAAGTGNLGIGMDGTPTSHCHAVFRDRKDRIVGGHLLEGRCVAGSGGVEVEIGIIDGAHFTQRLDAETQFPLFFPSQGVAPVESTVIVKLQPNQDLTTALEQACRSMNIRRAKIRSAVGSLSEAVIAIQSGESVRIAGPGLEVAGLCGEVDIDDAVDATPKLRGFVCQANGVAVAGSFVRERNPICVTYELVLERLA